MRKISKNEVEKTVLKEGYELYGEYINNRTPLKLKYPKGHITNTLTFSNFKKGVRCSQCNPHRKLQYAQIKEKIEKEGYKLLSNTYKNANTKLELECPKGHRWNVKYGHFYSGRRCGICSNNKKLDYEYIKEGFAKEGYVLISDKYERASSPLTVICNNGHKTNTISWHNFKRGQRCSICSESKGERKIREFLNKEEINFLYDSRCFKDLVSPKGYPLRPDFILPDHKIWIEYDGEFHFRKIHENDNHEEIKLHDKLKDEYAKKNGWKMIRIPYTDFNNIEDILINIIK